MLAPRRAAAALRGRRPDRRGAAARRAAPPARAGSARSPPLNLWVRTAPRGAEHFCWRIDIAAAADAPRRARARHRRAPQHRRARAGAPRELRDADEGARPARRARARCASTASVVGAIGPGLLVLLGVTHDDDRGDADRLADKVRALRIFADAEGRMNEPLGDREVLCVSQFTLYGDARKGNRPSYVGGRAARARRAALRALLRAPRRAARRVRRAHGGRARQRRAGDAAARARPPARLRAPCRPRPLRPPLRRRAAAGAAALRPLGRDAAGRVPRRAACASTARTTSSARPGEIAWFPDRTWHGRTYVPATARTSHRPRALRLRLASRRRRDGEPADFHAVADVTERDRRGQPGLADRPLRRGRRRLARRGAARSRR